jgi:hypothetical protein
LRWHIPARGPPLWDDYDAPSVDQVKHDSILVDNAGQTMRNIVTCVLEVSSSVEFIRDSAPEQMEGVKHIHAAVSVLAKGYPTKCCCGARVCIGANRLANETQ